MKRLAILFVLAVLLPAPSAFAKTGAADKKSPGAAPGEDRKKAIDFDGEVVEGMNKQPLDSLNQVSEGDGNRSKNHLYRRAKKFKDENRELAREILETY